jgi:hypothetical protein
MEEKRHKGLELRCPKLGGEVTFAYCLVEGELTQEQWDRCFGKTPKDKMVSLVELIEAAKKRQQEDS